MTDAELSHPTHQGTFFSLFQQIPLPVLIMDHDGRIRFANLAASRLFTQQNRSLVGRYLVKIKGEKEGLTNMRQEQIQSAIGKTTEMQITLPSGDVVFTGMQIINTQWHDRPSLLTIFQDISDQKFSEEALSNGKQIFRGVVQAAAEPLIIMDDSGEIMFFNQAAEQQFGFPAEEVIGNKIDLLFQQYLPLTDRSLMDLMQIEKPGSFEHPVELVGLCKGNSTFPAECTLQRTKLEGRTIFTIAAHDLTETREKAAAQIKHAEEIAQFNQTIKERTGELKTAANELINLQENVDQLQSRHETDQQDINQKQLTIKQFQNKIKDLEQKSKHQLEKFIQLTDKHSELRKQLLTSQTEIKEIHQKFIHLTRGHETLLIRHQELEDQCDDQKSVIIQHQQQQQTAEEQIQAMQKIIKNLEQNLRELQANTTRQEIELSSLTKTADACAEELLSVSTAFAHALRSKEKYRARIQQILHPPLLTILNLSNALQQEIYGTVNPRQEQTILQVIESAENLTSQLKHILSDSENETSTDT